MENLKYKQKPKTYRDMIEIISTEKAIFEDIIKQILGDNIEVRIIIRNAQPPEHNDFRHFNFKSITQRIASIGGYNYFILPQSGTEKTIGGVSRLQEAPKADDLMIIFIDTI